MHTQCRNARGASIALVVLLSILTTATATAQRTGTPRKWRTQNLDMPQLGGGLNTSAAVTTLVLGGWTFGNTSCTGEGWTSVDLTADETNFGDFAGLASRPGTSELCVDNLGCVWGFLHGSTDNYVCGARPTQAAIPFGDPQNGYIWNEIQSPVMNVSGTGSSFGLRFSVYRDLRFENLVFYTWRVRSWQAGNPGEWKSNGSVYYGPTVAHGDWIIQDEPVGALIDPGAEQIQVAVGVIDMAGAWGGLLGSGACHSNAPYFDSVKVLRAASFGPQWSVDPADLFQDNFPTDGTATGTVRMDMARDINPRAVNSIQPGDSIVVSVNEPTVGLATDASGGPAVYLHVRDLSPGKSGGNLSGNIGRWPQTAAAGGWTTLRFDSVRTASGVIPGRYCVDLNDNLYTPGDSVLFYFSARDAAGRVTYWTEFIGLTVSESEARTSAMEMTCLPAQNHNGPAILFVDDADGSGMQPYFDSAFLTLGITKDVDRYDVRAADELVGNGPGSRVRNVSVQLADYYDAIIWSSGTNTAGTIGDGSGAPEKSPDAAMLRAFLDDRQRATLYINGDHVAAELARLTSASALALMTYIGYDVTSESHTPATAISPQIRSTPTSIFTQNGTADHFVVFGGCPSLNSFGLLAPTGTSVTEMTYGSTEHAAEVSRLTNERWVLMSGFGFEFIRDDELDGISDRAKHLRDILADREPILCSVSQASIDPEITGAKITWRASNCGRQVRITRTADWAGSNELIHVASVPPASGEFHDVIPYGKSAYYRLDEIGLRGALVYTNNATITRDAALTAFTATARDLGIEVAWEFVDRTGIESMQLNKRLRGTVDFSPVTTDSLLPASASHYFDRSFTPGARYEYRLTVDYNGSSTTSDIVAATAPHAATLGQNVPNPFNPDTRIPFLVPEAGHVEMAIFDLRGARVRTLVNEQRTAGYAEATWDGRGHNGARVASGIYFCRLVTAGQTATRKIVLVR